MRRAHTVYDRLQQSAPRIVEFEHNQKALSSQVVIFVRSLNLDGVHLNKSSDLHYELHLALFTI